MVDKAVNMHVYVYVPNISTRFVPLSQSCSTSILFVFFWRQQYKQDDLSLVDNFWLLDIHWITKSH